ncbi:MAG: flagellar biosynthesis anti-sigma factor FlgM, partial [Helicobacter sp.]|nr:flagellar biosynthesis anti-sigma factor FlgM [Helicobacter sp.]
PPKLANKDDKIDTSRVAEINEALAKGEYKIDIGGSAAKMARNLLGK